MNCIEVGSNSACSARHTCEPSWDSRIVLGRGLRNRIGRIDEALDRCERLVEEHRAFIREMTRRNEKVVEQLVRHVERAAKRDADNAAEVAMRLRELTEESKAQREGLFAAIDRLPPADRQ